VTKRWPTILALSLALVVAVYTGFRLPNAWVATQGSVSLFDGFHRRWVVGTLLRPLAVATDYNYWLFAAYGFVLLAIVLFVLVRITWRAKLASQRWLVIAWLLLPTGGFLVHEAGYLEQINYLLLFAGIALLRRNRLIAATCLIAITPFVHEVSLVTTTPLFGLVALRTLPFRRALLVTAIPAAGAALVLLLPTSNTALATLIDTLSHANFPFRADAVPKGAFKPYINPDVVGYVAPLAVFLMAMFALLARIDGGFFRRDGLPEGAVMAASLAAVGLPVLLIWAGWDANRWAFFLITNFFIVVWICLDGRDQELGRKPLVVLALTALVLTRFTLFYFDRYVPRDLTFLGARQLVRQIDDGSLFAIPKR
jgi:hypothetical protein